ncbi:MAG TPA: class I SAM-dependent methyltransferase [Dongiaceae bacterium]|nr:class I SAM-dependent methyltransferase [Dongiaceae bacterium]
MSRLESFIRRLQAQRACLNAAVDLVRDQPGPVLEFGLGNGRSYDHLREICGPSSEAGREIYVFDRQVAAHPDCIPPQDRLFVGDFATTLPRAIAQLGRTAAMVHVDCGSGKPEIDAQVVAILKPGLLALMRSGAVLLSDQEIADPGFIALPLPAELKPGRYFMLRRN